MLRFRLKWLIAAVLVLAIIFGRWVVAAQQQRAAVQALVKQGLRVGYLSPEQCGMLGRVFQVTPNWCQTLFHQDYFLTAMGVTNTSSPTTHFRRPDLRPIRHLPRLQALSLWYMGVKDDDLEVLRSCKSLQTLKLQYLDISDDVLQHIACVKGLRRLSLRQVHITDGGVLSLAGLKNLETLSISGTHVTEEGVRQLEAYLPECVIEWSPISEWHRPPRLPYSHPETFTVIPEGVVDIFD